MTTRNFLSSERRPAHGYIPAREASHVTTIDGYTGLTARAADQQGISLSVIARLCRKH